MSQSSNTRRARKAEDPLGRPLTARSVIASLLLGTTPPRLRGRHLVDGGRLFGIEEGTLRVALSRMVAAGELVADDGVYQLAGPLLERQRRTVQSRSPKLLRWKGTWTVAVVPAGRRDAEKRLTLRSAATVLRFGELRDGVWLRPDNLDRARLPEAFATLSRQCHVFEAKPDDPATLVAALWDTEAWAARAESYRIDMAPYAARLEAHDTDVLAPSFRLAAQVVRHIVADPLLPPALLPADWPGPALREDLDRYEKAFKVLWSEYFKSRQ